MVVSTTAVGIATATVLIISLWLLIGALALPVYGPPKTEKRWDMGGSGGSYKKILDDGNPIPHARYYAATVITIFAIVAAGAGVLAVMYLFGKAVLALL